MKKQFWFVGLFGVWCLLSALWYFLSVKGVKTNPENFSAQTALVAILEILVMLLVACLLGYAIAWWMRDEEIESQNEQMGNQQRENLSLAKTLNEQKSQTELWREKHRHDLHTAQQKLADLIAEKEKFQKIKLELESSLKETLAEKKQTLSNLKNSENELGTVRYQIRQLEFQLKEAEEVNSKLTLEMVELMTRKEKSASSDHPFVKPVEPDHKDDLTKIKGIGPFIEKRLNMIGIYTLEQLAVLSPDMIDRVGAAIEFFPHRIIRDNWVGQARSISQR
jgi:predicted flap endonuclease-1-like 5' DNA nuclease